MFTACPWAKLFDRKTKLKITAKRYFIDFFGGYFKSYGKTANLVPIYPLSCKKSIVYHDILKP
jgi:hypothetical protein